MRTHLETKEWANALAHLSGARRKGLFIGPILSEIRGKGPFIGPILLRTHGKGPFIWPISAGCIEMALLLGPFFGPFFGASPQPARRNPDTPLASQQGQETTKAPAPGCRRGAGIVCSPSMSPWNPPALVPWVADCLDCFLRQSKLKHPPAPIGALWRHRVRAPRRLAASHVFASLQRLGQGCAPTPRGGLRCALAARRVRAWEGRP
jgi:hypothetical protein